MEAVIGKGVANAKVDYRKSSSRLEKTVLRIDSKYRTDATCFYGC